MKVTEQDLNILVELQKDAKQPLKDLSKKLKVPISTLHSRISKLEKSGVIKKYTAILDPGKLDMDFTALVFCTLKFQYGNEKPVTMEKIVEKIKLIPEVQSIFLTTGQRDLILKIKSHKVGDVSAIIADKIRSIKGIEGSETYVCFDVVKESLDLPLND
ncbi:Lrp/AsnC family transcriptional regulator [Candidatus Undinarchaeota archaeon]